MTDEKPVSDPKPASDQESVQDEAPSVDQTTASEQSMAAEPEADGAPAGESNQVAEEEQELQSLMRRALRHPETKQVDVLRGVQERLRTRSQGKFYRDAWSTARHPPIATYFITSLMMLAVLAIIYAIITPIVGDPVPLPTEPSPVQVIPPAAGS